MTEQRLTLKSAALAVLIVLAGLPLRFDLAQRLYLDFDEAMYFQAASEPTLADSWEASRIHTHPPLAFLMYHEWLNVGDSEWLLRLPSIVLGAVATWIAYLWLARVTDRRAALVGVFVMTFALPVLHVSAQMRSYTLLFVFAFGALWFNERFRETRQLRHLTGEVSCLMLALLTHYAAAWLIGVLGVVGLVRSMSWGLSSRATRGWGVSQFLLAGACLALYVTHIRGFVGGTTQEELWSFWMHGNRFGETLSGRLMFAIFSSGRFFGGMFGFLWAPMLCAAGAGVWLLSRRASVEAGEPEGVSPRTTQRPGANALRLAKAVSVERVLLVALPFVFAIVLQTVKVYPFGATRHSLWLLPFLLLAISVAARPLLSKSSAVWRIGVAVACLLWAGLYPVRFVSQFSTKLTPELMRQTVAQWKSSISREDLILTDEGTRNVLAYYLGRAEVDRGRELAHGFREYRIDGFRVVTIPKFHFFMYSLRDDWPSFADSLGEHSTQPLWLAYMGFEVPGNDLKSLGQRLPPAQVLARHMVGDNHLLRVQFREPQETTAAVVHDQTGEPEGVSPRTGREQLHVRGLTPSGSPAQRTVRSGER